MYIVCLLCEGEEHNILIREILNMFKMCILVVLLSSILVYTLSYGSEIESNSLKLNNDEIHGYHFHTYFFQDNLYNSQEALQFREVTFRVAMHYHSKKHDHSLHKIIDDNSATIHAIQEQIDNGFLANCRLNRVNMVPRGPHPIGSYETCCNKTSISPALSWFMQNHGNLSVLLHPLTRYEVLDHTTRAMYLGPSLFLDISKLSPDLGDNLDLCLPITQ